MALIELTDDEQYWLSVALENSKEAAARHLNSDDLDEALDAGLLVQRYTQLQEKFPAPDITME